MLTDGVDQHPHCVLLLDEIEKAHPDLFNVLLQIMDHGKLTDHSVKQVDFRHVILVMTTNAGAAEMARAAFGFTRTKREGDDMEAINRMFAPEFRNRLDATITFGHLSREVIAQVVAKFVMQLEAQLADRNVTIELSEEPGAKEGDATYKLVVKAGDQVEEHEGLTLKKGRTNVATKVNSASKLIKIEETGSSLPETKVATGSYTLSAPAQAPEKIS